MSTKIVLEGVSLWRRTQEENLYDLKRLLLHAMEGKHRKAHRRQVLCDVSLTIGAGEKVGIIGANGCGKSTLLKVVCSILRPTTGTVHVDGTLAPLIELGAGFDGEMSVIENIRYYGILLGYPHNLIEERIGAILDFAELHDHVDEPLKTLSSGMNSRLGFAIATDTRPDILILDEILSVGDEAFKRKCAQRVSTFWDAHSTIIAVSHDLAFIRSQCERAIWMESGRIVMDGAAEKVADAYLDSVIGPRGSVEDQASMREALLRRAELRTPPELVVRGSALDFESMKIFLIRDGYKIWIREPEWLARNGYQWPDDVEFVDDDIIRSIPDLEAAPV